ncbi:MAG: PD-(D/E)XK nuclease family transposase [Clostridia bacterium]|nr:PD-(D/E)XK nuclease family transposase [Clostridia bacterium]
MNRKFIKNSNLVLHEILNSEKCKDIIADFIETFLKIPISTLKINPNLNDSKSYGIVDVRVITKENNELNVGIQIIDGNYIQSKMLLYYAKIHTNQALYEDGRRLAKTTTINILDMSFFSSLNFHKIIKLKTNAMNDSILEEVQMHIIELPKLKITKNMRLTKEEAWVLYLRGDDRYLIAKAIKKYECIKKLDDLLKNYWKEEKI